MRQSARLAFLNARRRIQKCQATMTGQLGLISWLLDVVVGVILLRQTELEDELNTLTTQYTHYSIHYVR